MTESEIKVYDDFITVNKLEQSTGLPKDRLRSIVKKAMIANNFAYILADVVDSFISDCDDSLKVFDKCFSYESKKNFKEMRQHIIAARKCSMKLCEPVYKNIRTNAVCADSDWWLAMIKLIDDRTTDSYQKTQMLLEFLLNMPEGDSPYKVKFDDFKLFKD